METLRTYLNKLSACEKEAFSTRCGKKIPYLRKAICLKSKMEPKTCVSIEFASNGEVSRKDLRDDWREIWPELAN